MVLDELEIRNVIARIAQLSDAGDLDEYAAQFTEDACWEMPGVPVRHGRHEIRAAGAARRAEGVTGPGACTRHVITTVTVRLGAGAGAGAGDSGGGGDGGGDGGRRSGGGGEGGPRVAVAESYWQFYVDTATAPTLRTMGHYRDTFRRTDSGWQLAHRQITNG